MFFKPIRPEKVRADQLYEAQRLVLEHAAAAEHHKALADMYAARIKRLEDNMPVESFGKAVIVEHPSMQA